MTEPSPRPGAGDRHRSSVRRPLREQLSHAARIAEMMMGLPAGRPEDFGLADRDVLRIGVSSSLSCGRLRALLRGFRATATSVDMQVASLSRDTIAHRLKQGVLDIGLVCGETPAAGLCSEPLWREALYVVLPADHPLARDNAVAPARLTGQTVLTSRSDLGGVERLCQAALAEPPLLAILPTEADRETLFNLVALGFGLAMTSASALGAYYPGVVYRPLLGCEHAVPYEALWREGNRKPALAHFLGAARASF
ncbi:LysR family substrate-binding domain-containing protein [Caulobacter sp.]|uniref:LysR family substrate-binding domain-containing protein n=1 Tax=Caulobacter sp. TaxID=78 RepID=UPI003BAFA5EB